MIRTTFLSAAALSLAMVAPAYAQTAMGGPVDMEQVKERLGEAGIEERRDFGGTLFRAQTEDGQTVFMMVTPRDLGETDEIEVSESDLRERFEEAGFANIERVEQAQFVVGDLDDDKAIIVMRADDVRDMRAGMTPEPAATGTIAPTPPAGQMPQQDPGAAPQTPDMPTQGLQRTEPPIPGQGTAPATPGAGGLPGANPGDALGGGAAGGTIR
jgi:hypothetical protein